MGHRGALHLHRVGAGGRDDGFDLLRGVHEVVARGDGAGDMGDAHLVQRRVGRFEQARIRVELGGLMIRGAGFPLADEPHVGVQVAQRAAEDDVVDVQRLVEVACDAGEDHGVGMAQVDEVLRGGGRVDQPHAADGGGDLDGSAVRGGQGAADHVQAGCGGVGHVVERGGDMRHLLVHGTDDGDGGHAGSCSRCVQPTPAGGLATVIPIDAARRPRCVWPTQDRRAATARARSRSRASVSCQEMQRSVIDRP